ncbi:MAG: putative bifunctional diguanylate cyclase/phosphodiesterase, partial [Solirubrobacteraceae bacterium]
MDSDKTDMRGRAHLSRWLPLTADIGRRRARLLRVATLAVLAAWSVYLLYVVSGPWGIGAESFFRTWVFSGVLVAAAGLCIGRAALVRADRLIWASLGTGMLLWALGSIYWSAFIKHLEVPPYPSGADALYLSFYPAAYVALMSLARPRLRAIGPSVWLDGLIGVLAVSAIGTAMLVPSMVAGTGGTTAVVATNLAYPLCDLLLIALVVGGFALSSWRPGRTWALIGIGLIVFGIADSIYLYQVASGSFVEGEWLDAMWPAGMVLLAIAAWQGPQRATTHVTQTWPVLALPLLFSFASLGVLVYGNVRDVNIASLVLATGAVVAAFVRLVLSFSEVRALSETRRQATTDELTGLPNRRLLYERLHAQLRAATAEGTPLTLLIADLDGFKELNDTLGHHAGDLLLKQVGPRMLDVLRAGDTLARLGGDEFAVVLPGLDAEGAVPVVERIQAAIGAPFTISNLKVHVEVSIGVACSPDHASHTEELIQRADVAMYQAKQSRAGFEIYAAERDLHSRDRLSLLGDLRDAIGKDEFELHYQPKVDLTTRTVTGVEALIRWHHPERGLLGPMQFIPLAEHTALMRPLTLHVIETALRQCKAWRDDGLFLSVAVNLSVPNLLDLRLRDDVADLLEKWEIPANQLNLEVTENIVGADPVRIIEVLDSLKELGVGLSLDDFGTGTSSLAYLKRLPVDELKIDKSFVMAMDESRVDEAIVRSTTELAQRLGLRVVAEGVETQEALDHLTRIGCEEAQGYFLQRPVPAAALREWIDAWTAAEAA